VRRCLGRGRPDRGRVITAALIAAAIWLAVIAAFCVRWHFHHKSARSRLRGGAGDV